MVDLKRIVEAIDPSHGPSLRELKRLQGLVDVNRKREKDTYSKMFTGGHMPDRLEEEKKRQMTYKTVEELEYERERAKMVTKVKAQMEAKLADLSFEVLPESQRQYYPEMDDL